MSEIVVNFYWLLELFEVERGHSKGYANAALDSVESKDAYKAYRFASKVEAETHLGKVPAAPAGQEWRAVEHGFSE